MYLSRVARQVFVGFLFQITTSVSHPFPNEREIFSSSFEGKFMTWHVAVLHLVFMKVSLTYIVWFICCLIIRKILTACVAVWNILTQDQVLWRQIEANRVFRQRLVHVLNLSKKSNFLCGNHIKMPQVHRSQNTMLWLNWSITSMYR